MASSASCSVPEYVNVFGVPLSIFQDVGEGGEAPPPPKPSTQIESLRVAQPASRSAGRTWCASTPSCARRWWWIGHKVETLELDPAQIPIAAELAPALGGAADLSQGPGDRPGEAPGGVPPAAPDVPGGAEGVRDLGGRFTGAQGASGLPAHPTRRGVLRARPALHPEPVPPGPAAQAHPHLAQHRPGGAAPAALRHRAEPGAGRAGLRRGVPHRQHAQHAHLVHDQGLPPDRALADQPHGGRQRMGAARRQPARDEPARRSRTRRTTTSGSRSTTCGTARGAATSRTS